MLLEIAELNFSMSFITIKFLAEFHGTTQEVLIHMGSKPSCTAVKKIAELEAEFRKIRSLRITRNSIIRNLSHHIAVAQGGFNGHQGIANQLLERKDPVIQFIGI